jgi:hypothetical protein
VDAVAVEAAAVALAVPVRPVPRRRTGRRGGGGGRGPAGDDSPGSAVSRFAVDDPVLDFMQAQRRRHIPIHGWPP